MKFCVDIRDVFEEIFRILLETFQSILDSLVQEESLKASSRISVEEKLATFLFVVGQNASNRHTQERFQRSGSTISK